MLATEMYARIDVSFADLWGKDGVERFGFCRLPRTRFSLEALCRLLAGREGVRSDGVPDVLAVIAYGEALGPTYEEEIVRRKKFLLFGKMVARKKVVKRGTDRVDLLVVSEQGRGFVAETEPIHDTVYDALEGYSYPIFRSAGMRVRGVTVGRLSEAFDDECDGCRDERLQRIVREGVLMIVDPRWTEVFARYKLPLPERTALWCRDKDGVLHARFSNKGASR